MCFVTHNDSDTSIKVAVETLNELGVKLPKNPCKLTVFWSAWHVMRRLKGTKPSDVLSLPRMKSNAMAEAQHVMTLLAFTAYFGGYD